MLTPGFLEAQASLSKGILGWDKQAFYNPSFLMLTFHRAFANFSYGAFIVAGLCGIQLYRANSDKVQQFYEKGGRLAFVIGFIALLSLPIIGYFYAYVLKYEANQAFVNLMWGKGDVVAGGIDWWWLKHICVAGMLAMALTYFWRERKAETILSIPWIMVVTIGMFYLMFYLAMGMIMTWAFFWWMLTIAIAGVVLTNHLMNSNQDSPRSFYVVVGILSLLTVVLGGYAREASRPRFVNRIAHYDEIYVPTERQPYLMVDVDPTEIPPLPEPAEKPPEIVQLIRQKCIGCHTLERVKNYRLDNWELIVEQMRAYGLKLSTSEAQKITDHLKAQKPY